MNRLLGALSAALLLASCVGPADDPTNVKDLRVLGISMDPPELLAPSCELSPATFGVFAAEVQLTALLADPSGEGREVDWEVSACADPSDRMCANDQVRLASGHSPAGEVKVSLHPGTAILSDGSFLLQKVAEKDPFKGLGGLRLPVLLHLHAGEEQVYAQKLMVFTCQLFPQMKANLNPVLPGISADGAELGQGDPLPELQGPGPFNFAADDFTDRQEAYVVSSFELQPVNLVESWKLAWYADLGRFAPGETGGSDFGGEASRHTVQWKPGGDATERQVTFWVVARDGRGGESWWTRKVHYRP